MPRKRNSSLEMRSILFVDAVNFTEELKKYDRSLITAKINQLREFAEFFFIHKLKGTMIGELGDGFLILCPPEPHKILNEAFACMSFVRAYNSGKITPSVLNVRIAIHYGLIAPPEGTNYIDTNINLTSRLEGKTPPNCICVSSVVNDIVSDTLRNYKFQEIETELKGFGQSKFYLVSSVNEINTEPSRAEERLGFYLSTIDVFRRTSNWRAVSNTCKQALIDFKDNPEFTYQQGIASLFLKEYEKAISAFEICSRMNYNAGDSLHFIGRAYCRLGDDAKAAEMFTKAIDREPELFHSMHNLGEISLKRGDYDQAWQWASRAAKLAPKYFAPRALQIALVVFLKKKRSIENLMKSVPSRNQSLLRRDTEDYLKSLGAIEHMAQIDLALKSVYGATYVRTLTNRKSYKNTQQNREGVKRSNKAIKPTAR